MQLGISTKSEYNIYATGKDANSDEIKNFIKVIQNMEKKDRETLFKEKFAETFKKYFPDSPNKKVYQASEIMKAIENNDFNIKKMRLKNGKLFGIIPRLFK